MKDHQLFKIIPEIELVHYFDAIRGEVKFREANNLPFICWPSGEPCLVANAYMIYLFKRNLSRNNNGGTLRQVSSDISHLIRFCYENRIDFIQMNRDRFNAYIAKLRDEKHPINRMTRKRDSNTLIAIGRKCLDFLDFVGKLNGDDRFVIDSVYAQQKKYLFHTSSSRTGKIERLGWHHESFDTPDPRKSRSPISKNLIQKLYEVIPIVSSTNLSQQSKRFIDRRRTIMLRLLEMTGARIEEIARINIKDIEATYEQSNPALRLVTLKKKSPGNRFVPVMHQDISVLKAYIKVNRPAVIKRTIGATHDHGYLFVSDVTGKPLTSKYMSNEIGLLRRAAGITTQACAHMFRHRFITKLFVRLINQYDYENKDDFRRALLDANTLKQQVQQYTGHTKISSLDTYIDLAFNEVANLEAIVNTTRLQEAYERFDSNVELLQKELMNGLPVLVYLEKYNNLLNSRTLDLDRFNSNLQKLEK